MFILSQKKLQEARLNTYKLYADGHEGMEIIAMAEGSSIFIKASAWTDVTTSTSGTIATVRNWK